MIRNTMNVISDTQRFAHLFKLIVDFETLWFALPKDNQEINPTKIDDLAPLVGNMGKCRPELMSAAKNAPMNAKPRIMRRKPSPMYAIVCLSSTIPVAQRPPYRNFLRTNPAKSPKKENT